MTDNSKRDLEILKRRRDGLTLRAVGAEFGLSKDRIRSIVSMQEMYEQRAARLLRCPVTAKQLVAFEHRVIAAWNNGEINGLTHFALSDNGFHEQWLVDFYMENVRQQDWILASHRNHYHALLSGMPEEQLYQQCLSGHSMASYGPRLITSAIVAGVCGIAAGLALAAQQSGDGRRVFCFTGDGSTDEGSFAEAVRFVDGRDLPCTFIVESNNSSCGVTMEQRGMKRFQWPDCVIWKEYRAAMPHAGTGQKMTLKSLIPAVQPSSRS